MEYYLVGRDKKESLWKAKNVLLSEESICNINHLFVWDFKSGYGKWKAPWKILYPKESCGNYMKLVSGAILSALP